MIFEEQESRLPNKYPWTTDFITAMWTGHWTPNEFNFQADIQDFKVNITEQERQIIVNTLSAIGQIEVAVKKFWSRLGDNLPHPSLNDLGLTMAGIEVIHNIAYEKLLNVLGLQDVFEQNLKLDIIKNRVNYLKKYNKRMYADNKKQYIYSLILFTLFVENVSLFSQFYIVLWFNRYKNVLRDTAHQVNYTKLEEQLHGLAGVKIINTIREEYPDLFDDQLSEVIYKETQEAFKAESDIIDWILGSYQDENIDSIVLKEYVKNRLNSSLNQIGYTNVFEIDNDLIEKTLWMEEEVLANTSADFFHRKPVEYAKSSTSFDEEDIWS
jgi:ribonucleoside-diphosphate reductase beta chain